MNHSTSGPKPVSKAISGFLYFKSAEGLADRTLDSYERTLQKWVDYIGEVNVTKITSQDISTYLNWLRTEYTPKRFSGKTHPLSPKTIRNVWIAFSSFFDWARKEFQMDNPMKEVPGLRFQKAPVDCFIQDEVRKLIKACLYAKEADTRLCMQTRFILLA